MYLMDMKDKGRMNSAHRWAVHFVQIHRVIEMIYIYFYSIESY